MRVLLVGLGRWGEKHLRVLAELGVEVWVADLAEERRAFAVRAGVPAERAVEDFRTALPHVDAVDLVTPADSHRLLAGECLGAGKDCFLEKPLALTVGEGQALAEAQARSGRILQVGHIFRFHPVTEVLRQWLAGGETGPVRYCTGRFAGFKRPRTDVGVTMTDALHYFDLFTDLLGQLPIAVTASLRDYLGRGLDDCSFSTVEYGAIPAFIEAGYFAPGTYRDCVIVGERTTLAADFVASEVRIHHNRHVRESAGWQAPEGAVEIIKASGPEPLRRELELFLDAVASRQPPAVDVEAGVLALRTVEAAQRSSALGRRVMLAEIG
ncbi:MAG TPA: Gfo/Idh/MocA family oxidoreductase [Methylomirabilota bacterium]|jgi:UDP-N-acetylglucosamine 3-dehydrogenase|nr:Gfo/Idh/MocA family oxidoreductase [Methylomirabilota bacterium]